PAPGGSTSHASTPLVANTSCMAHPRGRLARERGTCTFLRHIRGRVGDSRRIERDMSQRWVYFFGDGEADGGKELKDLLGGKGANLGEMTRIGVPVPPGFTI